MKNILSDVEVERIDTAVSEILDALQKGNQAALRQALVAALKLVSILGRVEKIHS